MRVSDAILRGRPTFPDYAVAAFRACHGRDPAVVVRAPGRVSFLGAHVDMSEGWVMPAAIDRALWLAAAPSGDALLELTALDLDATATLDLERLPPPMAEREAAAEAGWSDYPAAVAWTLREAGRSVVGMRAVYAGDLPVGAGLSSSAALEVAFLLAWERLGGFALEGLERARLGRRAENAYLGVDSGIMDQFASVHGRANHLLLLDCRDLNWEPIPLPAGMAVLLADSGVRRRLQGSGFNNRRQECREALAILQRQLPGIRALRDVSVGDFELHAHRLPPPLRRRVQHTVEECARVQEGARALRRGDLDAFAARVRRSHASSRDLYEVSLPELDVLAASAWAVPGCYGARFMGGGFGGVVAALVAPEAVDAVARAMTSAFDESFRRRPAIWRCRVADGAAVVSG